MDKKHPIGAQILTKTMMDCSFHHTDDVLKVIEDFRETAASVRYDFRDKLLKAPDEALMDARGFNNAVSILGSRGTGKTSVIMTLQHILKVGKENWASGIVPDKRKPYNIMLPILIPQDYSPKQTLLSWLIIQLLQKAEQIERELASEGKTSLKRKVFEQWIKDKGEHYKCDPLRECMDALKLSFELRYKNGLKRSGEDSDQVYHYMDEVRRDSGLVLDFLKLVTMMADYYRYRINGDACQSKPENEPLFFFVIDDLDLAPERSQEVLLLMLRYLQHPNIVVLCGWYEQLFQTHLCIEILKNQGALEPELLDTNFGYDDVFMKRRRQRVAALDSARRLAIDNLKKAFPPAQRFEIRSLSTEQRADFPVLADNQGDADKKGKRYFFEYIEDTLQRFRNTNEPVEFLYNYHHEYLKIYMRIFDNKARGMANVVKAFREFRENAVRWDRKKELYLTASMKALLDAMLFSNTHFAPYRCGIRDLVKIKNIVIQPDGAKGENICEYYCNFNGIIPVFEEYEKQLDYAKENYTTDYIYEVKRKYNYFPYLVLDTFLLLNFMQNVFRYICGVPTYEHGGYDFARALNKVINPIVIDVSTENLMTYAVATTGLRRIELFPFTEDIRINLNLWDAYERVGLSDLDDKFSGSGSYRCLSQALYYLVTKKEEARIDYKATLSPVTPIGQFNYLWDRAHGWFSRMMLIFDALYFSKENVRRLTLYRSYMAQDVYINHVQVLDAVNQPRANQFIARKKLYKSIRTPLVPNSVLNRIVDCLRATDRLRSVFFSAVNLSRRSKRDASRLEREYRFAVNYLAISITYNDKVSLVDFDFSDYYRKLSLVRNVSNSDMAEIMYDEDTFSIAMQQVNQDISALLSLLHQGLESALFAGYNAIRTNEKKFEYMLNASKAISRYVIEWELGYGNWSEHEREAVNALIQIFERNGLTQQYSQAKELSMLGPEIDISRRDRYTETLYDLKNKLFDRLSVFSDDEEETIRESIGVLERAIYSIRRKSMVESSIQDVLTDVGVTIAQGCAEHSFKDKLLMDRTSWERHMTSWPIVEKSRDEFDRWQNEFGIRQYIHRDAPDTNVSSTFFDMNL